MSLGKYSILSAFRKFTACGGEWEIRPLSCIEYGTVTKADENMQLAHAVAFGLKDAGMTAEEIAAQISAPLVVALGGEILRISQESPAPN